MQLSSLLVVVTVTIVVADTALAKKSKNTVHSTHIHTHTMCTFFSFC